MKPIVFLVDSVITHNFKQYIRTAFETIQDLLPNRKEPQASGYWGNMYTTNFGSPKDDHYETSLNSSPTRVRYEALSTAILDGISDYVYLIPCNSDMDVTNIVYLQMLSPDNLYKIANNNINILFDYSYETIDYSFTTASNIHRLELYLRRFNPGYSGKIIVSSTNEPPDPEDSNYGYPLRAISLPWRALMDRPRYKTDMPVPIDLDRYLTSKKDYLFMNLNQNPRMHRVFFIHRLFATGLARLSRTSYMARNPGQNTPQRISIPEHTKLLIEKQNNFTADDILTLMRASTVDQPPIKLDDDLPSMTDFNQLHNPEWCYDTCFDIISETGSFSCYNSPSITEKTFKAMFYKRPFMINGDAGGIKMLQKMGFRTFPNIFNETYDSFPAMFDRHGMIIDNIRLFEKDYARAMFRIRATMYDIEYNYARLMDPGSIENIILELLSKELSK